ncbi:MAG TPA: hypothetical protein VEA99_19265 [Gemmatimonadaceae bacterium]|nr:hypothetical protein [Gemmatimonadaceae bacterium]
MTERARLRRGFALLAVLLVMVTASLLGLAAALTGRIAFDAAGNRVTAERAAWRARGCAERAVAAADAALEAARTLDAAEIVWRTLDAHVARSPLFPVASCAVALEAAGSRLDVNAATDEQLRRLFDALGHRGDAEAMADAIVDWRDEDELPRPMGAERDAYDGRRQLLPRNAPFADARELRQVRGLALLDLAGVLDVEPGRISVHNAPAPVLGAVPGFTEETVRLILQLRDDERTIREIPALAGMLSTASANELMARYQDVARMATVDPDGWIVRATAGGGYREARAVLEWRIVRTGRRVTIVRQRSLA